VAIRRDQLQSAQAGRYLIEVWIENAPDLNSLRDNPRFQAILDRV
jgi:hypothetical protein